MAKLDEFRRSVLVANALLNNINDYDFLDGNDVIKQWADSKAKVKGYYFKNKAWPVGKIRCMNCLEVFTANTGTEKFTTKTISVWESPKDNGRTLYNYSQPSVLVNKEVMDGSAVCPHCGRPLVIEQGRKFLDDGYLVVGVPCEFMGISVLRVFESNYYLNANDGFGFRNRKYGSWREVLRKWSNGEREIITSRSMGMGYNSKSPWSSGDIEYRHTNSKYCNDNRSDCEHNYANTKFVYDGGVKIIDIGKEIYTKQVYEQLRKYHSSGLDVVRIIRNIKNRPMIETAINAGYMAAAFYLANNAMCSNGEYFYDYVEHNGNCRWIRHTTPGEYANALRLCIKNGYSIPDAQMYYDYLNDLKFFNEDYLMQVDYICPTNFMEAHTKWTERVNDYRRRNAEIEVQEKLKRDKEYLEKKLKEAAANESRYMDMKHAYIGIAFGETKENLQFHVIGSVAEMVEEGHAMHHCVGGYWNRPDSLIISCRYADGTRLATIEIYLRDFHIVQTRAVCNTQPEHFDLINSTIRANIGLIKKAKAVMMAETKTKEQQLNIAM